MIKQATKQPNNQPTNQPTNQTNKQINNQTNKQINNQTNKQLTNQLTNKLNYWRRIFLEKLIVIQINKEISKFYGTRKFITTFTAVPILTKKNPVHDPVLFIEDLF